MQFFLVTALSALIVCIGIMSGGARASDLSEYTTEQVNNTTQIYDAIVRYPHPIWYQKGDPHECCKYSRTQEDPLFVLEYIPKDQEFGKWTELYAVQGEMLFQGNDISVERFFSMTMNIQANFCGRENFVVEPIMQNNEQYVSVLFCEAYASGPDHVGYGPDVGEISVVKQFKIGRTLLQVYHRWRGAHLTFAIGQLGQLLSNASRRFSSTSTVSKRYVERSFRTNQLVRGRFTVQIGSI